MQPVSLTKACGDAVVLECWGTLGLLKAGVLLQGKPEVFGP